MASSAPSRAEEETSRDSNPAETSEWLQALRDVMAQSGPERASELLGKILEAASHEGVHTRADLTTPYVKTIPAAAQPALPGDAELEQRLHSLVRWNAIAMVLQANAESSELGGHIASYQSASTLYEVGFNHFWR